MLSFESRDGRLSMIECVCICFLRSAGWMMGICTHENKANFRQASYVIKQTFICSDRTKKNPQKNFR